MTGKERIRKIFNREQVDRTGFWLGNPVDEAKKKYFNYFGVKDDLELAVRLGNDLIWIPVEKEAWKHPQGKPIFDLAGGKPVRGLNQAGIFAEVESIREIDAFAWPNLNYLDFSSVLEKIGQVSAHGMAVFSGLWTSFFNVIARFFGMENYFIKMHTQARIVEAVTERVVDFYLNANWLCFEALAGKMEVFFLGNDFGTQQDLLISPEAFSRFILPGLKKNVELAKSYNLKVVLHSCGAISKLIPLLIDIGIDGLHPLQVRARGMEAENLAKEFKNHLVFIGGVDTQELLPFRTPKEVFREVKRLKSVFGERFIVSPSHEALLPNVSPENIMAMRDAAMEMYNGVGG